MQAGLFLCDHVHPDYRDQFGDYDGMFARLFPEFNFRLYDVCNGRFPDDLDECDVYLATGSLHSVYEDLEWIDRIKEVIRELYRREKYFIGVCFGHQLLGDALGGKVGKSPNGWCVGVHEFEIIKPAEWMQPFHSTYSVVMMCQDQVLQLPENATVLAGNKMCPVGMFQVGDRMLGIQGHPEFSKAYDRFLIELRRDRIGPATVKSALESLAQPVNVEVVHDWILRFLQWNSSAMEQ